MTNQDLIEYLEGLGLELYLPIFSKGNSFSYKYANTEIQYCVHRETEYLKVDYLDSVEQYRVEYKIPIPKENLWVTTIIGGINTAEQCKELVERHKDLIFKSPSVNIDYLKAVEQEFKHD